MPTHDRVPGAERPSERNLSAMLARAVAATMRRAKWGRRGRDPEGGEGVPVTPDRPSNLSGGAAAALEFDE